MSKSPEDGNVTCRNHSYVVQPENCQKLLHDSCHKIRARERAKLNFGGNRGKGVLSRSLRGKEFVEEARDVYEDRGKNLKGGSRTLEVRRHTEGSR